MADLAQRTDNALNEARTLMLLGQVLFAYAFESVFEKTFVELPQAARFCALGAATLLAVCIAFLLMPASFHWIAERGEDSEAFHGFVSRVVDIVLPLFSTAMALEIFVMTCRPLGERGAAAFAGGVLLVALVFLEALELVARSLRHD